MLLGKGNHIARIDAALRRVVAWSLNAENIFQLNIRFDQIIEYLDRFCSVLAFRRMKLSESRHKVGMHSLPSEKGVHRDTIMVRQRLQFLNAYPARAFLD